MVVEVLTDKINRSVAAVRSVVKDYGGKMADSGSVMFKFRRVRVVNIKVTEADKDQLFIIALDAGAEDVIDPPSYEDDTDEDREERYTLLLSLFCFFEMIHKYIFVMFFVLFCFVSYVSCLSGTTKL